MDLYEPLFRRVLLPAYETGMRRRKTLAYLREYERDQWLDPERLRALQWAKLQRLLAHCWDQVPYYRRRWREIGIADARDIRDEADYARLPVLTKPEIRSHFEEFIAPARRDGLLYKTTGGSTGEPLRFGYTRESYERRIAVMWRGYGWAGARLGQRTLYLWGLSPGKQKAKEVLYHRAFNRRMLNAFEMSQERMAEYADAFDAFRPETVVSYVTPILALADWLLANGRKVRTPQRILTAAETLHAPQRERIEEAFGCPAYNTYGCREFMLVASECEHRDGLHLTADHLKVELGQPIDAGDATSPRDIIVTDLHNDGMPLLRYANGDLATPAEGRCACGRGLPRLGRVDGRRLDALRTADGRFVPGEFVVYAFLGAKGIRRFQVVQRELESLDITIVRDDGFEDGTLDYLRDQLRKCIGPDTALNFGFSDAIPVTATGKHRVTISELP